MIDGIKSYHVAVNGEPVIRPYSTRIPISAERFDEIRGIELIEFKGGNEEIIGRGWYAKTRLVSSLPRSVAMRGISVRQGNIEVGDEDFLNDFFTEKRFALWHIGEIHLNYAIRPNARRDGFEQCPAYERFLEQLMVCGRALSRLCRDSSKLRSARIWAERETAQIERLLDSPVFVDKQHLLRASAEIDRMLAKLNNALNDGLDDPVLSGRVKRLQRTYDRTLMAPPFLQNRLDGRSLRHYGRRELIAHICNAIIAENSGGIAAVGLLKNAVAPYLKRTGRRGSHRRVR